MLLLTPCMGALPCAASSLHPPSASCVWQQMCACGPLLEIKPNLGSIRFSNSWQTPVIETDPWMSSLQDKRGKLISLGETWLCLVEGQIISLASCPANNQRIQEGSWHLPSVTLNLKSSRIWFTRDQAWPHGAQQQAPEDEYLRWTQY